jgi:hypothetical protein
MRRISLAGSAGFKPARFGTASEYGAASKLYAEQRVVGYDTPNAASSSQGSRSEKFHDKR